MLSILVAQPYLGDVGVGSLCEHARHTRQDVVAGIRDRNTRRKLREHLVRRGTPAIDEPVPATAATETAVLAGGWSLSRAGWKPTATMPVATIDSARFGLPPLPIAAPIPTAMPT